MKAVTLLVRRKHNNFEKPEGVSQLRWLGINRYLDRATAHLIIERYGFGTRWMCSFCDYVPRRKSWTKFGMQLWTNGRPPPCCPKCGATEKPDFDRIAYEIDLKSDRS